MEIIINEISSFQQEIEATLSYEEIQSEIQDAYREESKKITIDGFRKGKAPLGIIKKLYGEAIEFKASETIANKKFWNIVDERKLNPVSTPKMTDIDFVPGTKLSFKIQYEVKPKFEVKNYKEIEVEKPIFKIKDADIDREIEFMLKPTMQLETSESVDDHNHKITVNLQRVDENGVPIIGQRSENIVIDLSDEKVNPQIKENAKGKKVNETFNFVFTDEHHHGEELHSEEYRYIAEITKIEKFVKPELTEELIKKISKDKASNIDELKSQIRKNFEAFYTKQSEEIVTNNLLSEIVKNNEFTAPPGYIKSVHKRLIDIERENAKRYKMPNFDETAVTEYYKPRAEWNAKWQIILENIAEAENIRVDETEIEEYAKKESETTGISVEKLIKYYKESSLGSMLLEEKVIKFLTDNAKIKDVEAEEKVKVKKG